MGSLCCILNSTIERITQENVRSAFFICNNHARVDTSKYTLVYALVAQFCANV